MNIFVTDINPIQCAINLDDKRVSHMPKECFEMISMALCRNNGDRALAPLIIWGRDRRFHDYEKFLELYNHKCTKWVASKRMNIWWIWCHAQALMEEYKHRFNKTHWLFDQFLMISHFIPTSSKYPKSFPNCSGYLGNDIFENYQRCLITKWFITDEIKPVVWTNRNKPNWINKYSPSLQGELYQEEFEDDLPF